MGKRELIWPGYLQRCQVLVEKLDLRKAQVKHVGLILELLENINLGKFLDQGLKISL